MAQQYQCHAREGHFEHVTCDLYDHAELNNRGLHSNIKVEDLAKHWPYTVKLEISTMALLETENLYNTFGIGSSTFSSSCIFCRVREKNCRSHKIISI